MIDWTAVAKERRQNTPEERSVLAGWTDWENWDCVLRSIEGDADFGSKLTTINYWNFGICQYILVPKERKLREWSGVSVIQCGRGDFAIRADIDPTIKLVELPEGYGPPTPPGTKVLTKEQINGLLACLEKHEYGHAERFVRELLK